MKRPPLILLALALACPTPWTATAAEPESASRVASAHFLATDAIDLKQVLPAPPIPGSFAAEADMEAVRQAQVWRTPEQVAWAKFIEDDNVFNHASVLGAWFAEANLPETARFFREVTEDANLVSRGTKALYQRPRPSRADQAVHPCVSVPASGSYPSGHSMRACLWAAVLGDIFPDQRVALEERARRACWGRVIGGVHFPSDVVGGRLLAEAILAKLRQNPAYDAAVKKCRAEAEPFLLKKAA